MNKAMMSADWKKNYTALLAEVRQLPSAADAEGMRIHLENILDSFRPPDERDWCAMHIEGHCPKCGTYQCPGCDGPPMGKIYGYPIVTEASKRIDILTVEFAACGCAVDFHKTCSCPKAEGMHVVPCPLHASAPKLLEALESVLEDCTFCQRIRPEDLPALSKTTLKKVRTAVTTAKKAS